MTIDLTHRLLSAFCAAAFALALAAAGPAQAQTTPPPTDPASDPPAEAAPTPPLPGPRPGEKMFDADTWRAFAEGKTLYYSTPAGILGREYYPPGGDRVIYIYFDGRCFDGTWFVEADRFCFDYDGLHCFEHIERDGVIIAREEDGDEQEVVRRTDEVLSCEPELFGSLRLNGG